MRNVFSLCSTDGLLVSGYLLKEVALGSCLHYVRNHVSKLNPVSVLVTFPISVVKYPIKAT